MKNTATPLRLLAVFLFAAGCRSTAPKAPAGSATSSQSAKGATAQIEALAPSPSLVVGHVHMIDGPRGFAILELANEAPREALQEGAELITRSMSDLRETGRLKVSRQQRGRTVGTTIIAGKPAPGDEVVWLAP